MKKLYLDYLEWLQCEVDELTAQYEADRKSAVEYRDKYVANDDNSYSDDLEMWLYDIANEYDKELVELCCRAILRGCQQEDLIKIFDETLYFYAMYLAMYD